MALLGARLSVTHGRQGLVSLAVVPCLEHPEHPDVDLPRSEQSFREQLIQHGPDAIGMQVRTELAHTRRLLRVRGAAASELEQRLANVVVECPLLRLRSTFPGACGRPRSS